MYEERIRSYEILRAGMAGLLRTAFIDVAVLIGLFACAGELVAHVRVGLGLDGLNRVD